MGEAIWSRARFAVILGMFLLPVIVAGYEQQQLESLERQVYYPALTPAEIASAGNSPFPDSDLSLIPPSGDMAVLDQD